MTYELADDEIAFIIRPTNLSNNISEWDGSIGTGVAVGDNFSHPQEILKDLLYVATLCSAFLDLMEIDEDIFDRVADHRYKLMMVELNKRSKEDSSLQETKGEVINFNAYTKTKGEA